MFQVVDKETGNIFTVYGTKIHEDKTMFLLHDGVGWFYDLMKHYKPL